MYKQFILLVDKIIAIAVISEKKIIMNKKNQYLMQRNEQMRRLFWQLQRTLPRMEAYATVGEQYGLSEGRVREIVAGYKS